MTETILRSHLMLFALLINEPAWWRPFKRRVWKRSYLLIFAALAGAINVVLSEEAAMMGAAGRRAAVKAGEAVN